MKIGKHYLGKFILIADLILILILEYIYMGNALNLWNKSTSFLQLFIILLCLIYFILIGKIRINEITFYAAILCFFMVSISVIIDTPENISVWSKISKSGIWFIVFLVGYNLSYYIKDKADISKIITCLFALFSILFFSNLRTDYSVSNANFVFTSVYYLLCCAPFAFLGKNKIIRLISFTTIVLSVILSFKRSAIAVLILIIIALLFNNSDRFKREITNKKFFNRDQVFVILGAAVVFFMVSVIIYNLNFKDRNINMSTMARIWTNRFSGENTRILIQKNVFSILWNSSIQNIIFGHGYNSVMYYSSSHLSAHNDYLEIMFNYGLITFFAFGVFIIKLIKNSKNIKNRCGNDAYCGYITALVIILASSIFSHMLTYSTYFLLLCLYLGYVLGLEEIVKTSNYTRRIS